MVVVDVAVVIVLVVVVAAFFVVVAAVVFVVVVVAVAAVVVVVVVAVVVVVVVVIAAAVVVVVAVVCWRRSHPFALEHRLLSAVARRVEAWRLGDNNKDFRTTTKTTTFPNSLQLNFWSKCIIVATP